MSVLLFENNFSTTLANPVAPSDTTITLVSVAGLPTIVGDEYFVLTLIDAATKLITEIVYVTALTGNVATVTRAQEGTTALSWLAGDVVAGQWTAGQAAAMQQLTQAQGQTQNYSASPTGTANAIVAAFSPVVISHVPGMPLRVRIANTNTGAVTFNPGPSAVAVVAPDGSALIAGDLIAGNVVTFTYNGASYFVDVAQATATRSGTVTLGGGLVPPGGGLIWYTNTPPSGYLELNGASLSTTTYASLFAVFDYFFGGSGANFSLPDTRGYFLRGWSHGSGIDSGRGFGSYQSDAFASHNHLDGVPRADNTTSIYGATTSGVPGSATNLLQRQTSTPTFQGTTQVTGAAIETRPINFAIMYCVKY